MAFITKDIVIDSEWTDVNPGDEVCVVDIVSGTKVVFRYGDTSTSEGMALTDKIMIDRAIQVRSVTGKAVIAVSMEE